MREGPTPLSVRTLLRPANGSSQPWFCTLSNDETWLVKFAGAGPGPAALCAEFIANRLGRRWQLPIPETRLVWLSGAVERAGTDEFWDVLETSEGWNLAVREIEDAENVAPPAGCTAEELAPMANFDQLLRNWDRTSMSKNLMRDGRGTLWWIDHGSCRFLHHLGARELAPLPSTHALFQAELTGRLPCPHRHDVETIVDEVPTAWLDALGMGRAALRHGLWGYLEACTEKPGAR